MHILSPVTDNCSSWVSGRGRMAVEIFSWPSLHERMCRTWASNLGPLACLADTLPIELPWYLIPFEPPYDKTNTMTVRQAKIQISMGIRPVWSESSMWAQWVAKDPSFLHADSEYSDQTWRMPRLICLRWAHIPFCWFCPEAAHFNSYDLTWGVEWGET